MGVLAGILLVDTKGGVTKKKKRQRERKMKEKPLTRSVLLRRPSASPMLHCHLAPLSHIKSFSSEAENYRVCEGEQFPLQIFPRWSISSRSASNQTSCYFQNLRKPAWDTKSGYYFFMVHSALFLQKKKKK